MEHTSDRGHDRGVGTRFQRKEEEGADNSIRDIIKSSNPGLEKNTERNRVEDVLETRGERGGSDEGNQREGNAPLWRWPIAKYHLQFESLMERRLQEFR